MNKEMKKIVSKFLLYCVILTCLLCLTAGAVTAKQRSEFNSYFTPYAVLTVKNTSRGITLRVDEKDYRIDLSKLKDLSVYRNYLYFTPFSAAVFFFESFFDFFRCIIFIILLAFHNICIYIFYFLYLLN